MKTDYIDLKEFVERITNICKETGILADSNTILEYAVFLFNNLNIIYESERIREINKLNKESKNNITTERRYKAR